MKSKIPILATYVGLVLLVSSLPGGNRTVLFAGADKVAHGLMFMVFGVLNSWTVPKKHVTVVTGAFVLGLTTELIQLFVPGRTFEVGDLVADMVGAATGWASYHLIRSRRKVRPS